MLAKINTSYFYSLYTVRYLRFVFAEKKTMPSSLKLFNICSMKQKIATFTVYADTKVQKGQKCCQNKAISDIFTIIACTVNETGILRDFCKALCHGVT